MSFESSYRPDEGTREVTGQEASTPAACLARLPFSAGDALTAPATTLNMSERAAAELVPDPDDFAPLDGASSTDLGEYEYPPKTSQDVQHLLSPYDPVRVHLAFPELPESAEQGKWSLPYTKVEGVLANPEAFEEDDPDPTAVDESTVVADAVTAFSDMLRRGLRER